MSSPSRNPDLLRKLLSRLRSRESLEFEFKRGKGGLPNDLWPTVSAFANTNGGWIIVGVREEDDGRNLLDDLKNPDLRLQDFYNQIRNPQKVSHPVCGADDATVQYLGSKPVLVIRVAAASRKDRPVYIGRNPYEGTYLRRNSGDYRCTEGEVKRMMREASDVTADSAILPGYTLQDLDLDALARYRRRYQTERPGSPWNGLDDLRFLQQLGAHRRDRQTSEEGFTVAGLLLFGTREGLRDWRSRHLIDYRRLPEDGAAQERWTDRVVWEEHLFGAFETIYPRLVVDLPNPFRLQQGVRQGEGPAHIAMREALVNLLVHADYAETDASLILRHDQGCRFQNPGNSRVPKQDLLSGDRSDPRKPNLVSAFRYIGLADEAGTGIPKILQAWHQLGYNAPDVDVGTERYEFALRLRYVHFLSDEDRAWLTALGEPSDESKQLALVHAKENGSVDNAELCALTGQHPADATKTLTRLRDDGLLTSGGSGRGTFYELAPRAQDSLDALRDTSAAPDHPALLDVDLASSGSSGPSSGDNGSSAGDGQQSPGTSQVSSGMSGPSSGSSQKSLGTTDADPALPGTFHGSGDQWAALLHVAATLRQRPRARRADVENGVVALCSRAALSLTELATLIGKGRERTRKVIQALMEQGAVGYAYPEAPSSPKQRYVATPRETS